MSLFVNPDAFVKRAPPPGRPNAPESQWEAAAGSPYSFVFDVLANHRKETDEHTSKGAVKRIRLIDPLIPKSLAKSVLLDHLESENKAILPSELAAVAPYNASIAMGINILRLREAMATSLCGKTTSKLNSIKNFFLYQPQKDWTENAAAVLRAMINCEFGVISRQYNEMNRRDTKPEPEKFEFLAPGRLPFVAGTGSTPEILANVCIFNGMLAISEGARSSVLPQKLSFMLAMAPQLSYFPAAQGKTRRPGAKGEPDYDKYMSDVEALGARLGLNVSFCLDPKDPSAYGSTTFNGLLAAPSGNLVVGSDLGLERNDTSKGADPAIDLELLM